MCGGGRSVMLSDSDPCGGGRREEEPLVVEGGVPAGWEEYILCI